MTEEEWERKSRIICEKVISHPLFQQAKAIYCYIDYRKEVATRQIIEEAWKLQKKVAVPKVDGDYMDFYYIRDYSDLEEGYKGILEPKDTSVASDNEALVIVPGVAFDHRGNRIGYGKGYYDKYLSSHTDCRTIAVCFELQMSAHIPEEHHDIHPDIIITEEQEYESIAK